MCSNTITKVINLFKCVLNWFKKVSVRRGFAKIGYLGLAVLAAGALFVAGRGLERCEHDIWGQIVNAVAVLGLGWTIVVLSHRIIQRSLLLMATFVLVFVFGIVVYKYMAGNGSNWDSLFESINSTLSVFFPSRGDYDAVNKNVQFAYPLLHFSAYLFIAMLGFSFFGRKVMSRSSCWFVFPRHRNIFWGYSDGGVLLASDFMSEKLSNKAVFVLPTDMPLSTEVEKYRFNEIDSIGGAVLYKDFSTVISRPYGSRHFFVTEDQELNVRLAFMVLEVIKRKRRKKYTIELFVRTEMAHIDNYFNKALEEMEGKVEVNIVNESELTARRFLLKYPLLEMPGIRENIVPSEVAVNGHFNILQLGYGWTGRAILNKIICNTQFYGSRFSATVFDRDLMTKHGFYPLLDDECFSDIPGKPNYYDIKKKTDIEIGSIGFKEWVVDNVEKFNRIVVTLGDDAFNVKIALSIAKVLNDRGMSYKETSERIFAHIRNRERYTYFEMEQTPISVFGNKNKIYTIDIIVNDELDEIASELYFKCVKDSRSTKESLWRRASIFDQESSRAAAIAIDNTLRICGKKRVKMSYDVKNAPLCLGSDNLKHLAENECRRWNAFRFTQGVKSLDLKKITYAMFEGNEPSVDLISSFNRHAALMNYCDLPKLDKKFNPLIARFNRELRLSNKAPYNPQKKIANLKTTIFYYDSTCLALLDSQQENAEFVTSIPDILSKLDYKIVDIR